MDRDRCSLCGGSFHPKHSCHFQEDSDDVFLTSFLDKLEEIAEDLERCRNNPSDGVSDSSAEGDESESSCLLEQDQENSFSQPDQNSLSSPIPVPTGCPLYVSTNLSFHDPQPSVSDASVENSAHFSAVRIETSGGVNGLADDNHFSSGIADCSTGSSEEHLSVPGPSGIQTQPLITQEGKRFLCDVCGGSFSQKNSLLRHYKKHSGEKPFACETCGHRCLEKSDLALHRRIHTGEKPYVCIVCNRGFSRSSHLRQHLRTHTGEKPYVCGLCNRGFSRSSHLRQHLQTHTGEKPFECGECGRKFSESRSLKRHLQTHSSKKEEPQPCEICENTYGSQAACNHHHHRKDEGK